MKHPNAFVASVVTGPTVLLIWLAAQAGIDLPETVAAAAVGLVIAIALWLGPKTRNG